MGKWQRAHKKALPKPFEKAYRTTVKHLVQGYIQGEFGNDFHTAFGDLHTLLCFVEEGSCFSPGVWAYSLETDIALENQVSAIRY